MDKYVLITGASSGIGRATAIRLSKTYPLVLGGRDEKRLEETRTMCENADEHLLWRYDLADVEGIADNLSAFLKANSVPVSGFVHSAGIAPLVPLRMTTSETMRQIMDVNFYSAVEILKLLTSKKINGKTLENVILISSISSQRGAKGMSLYSASKGALDSFARSMACELAPRVRVNTVLPGGIETPGTQNMTSDVGLLQEGSNSLLGEGKTSDIADIVAFLLSKQSRWITGQNFIVDGGRTSHC